MRTKMKRVLAFRVLVFQVLVFRVLVFKVLVFQVLVFRVLGLRSWFSGHPKSLGFQGTHSTELFYRVGRGEHTALKDNSFSP